MSTRKIFLSLDPSFRHTGYTVWGVDLDDKEKVVNFDLIKAGIIQTHKRKKSVSVMGERAEDAEIIAREIKKVIFDNGVYGIVSEIGVGSQSATASSELGHVTGVVIGVSVACFIKPEWVRPREAKEHCLFYSQASKEEVMQWALGKYARFPFGKDLLKKTVFEHIADSIIVFHTFIGRMK